MRRSKADVERYISSVESLSPQKEKPAKGFLFAKLYFEAKEYELAKRHVSAYLTVQVRDHKAHRFLGQLYEREGEIEKAVGCYKRSVDLNPAQRDLFLKVAELLCSKLDSRAEFWVEKAAKLWPGHPAVFDLKEKLLTTQGQQGWNQLYDLLQSELQLRPSDVHVNRRLVELYCLDGRLEDAARHCLAVERAGVLRYSLDWYSSVVHTLQKYVAQPNVSSNEKMCRIYQKELLLAHSNLLRLSLSKNDCSENVKALQIFDQALQSLKNTATKATDELLEVFTEMRAHLYLHAGTLLLKMAVEKEQQWRTVVDLAALCYLLAYQLPRPKTKPEKGEHSSLKPLEALASYRQSQAGHMLLNLKQDTEPFLKDVVEVFGNRSGQDILFETLFRSISAPLDRSFLGNDNISNISLRSPDVPKLAKLDSESILHCGDLQHLTWLGLQWSMMGQRPAVKDWLKHLFPRLTLETFKLETNTPESICLLDLEVFLCGVVFTSHTQLQETAKISATSQLHEPRGLPLQLMKLLYSERQKEWWDAVYSLIHKKAVPNTSAKLRMIVQHGLNTLRAREKHGLQPALLIHWAKHLSLMGARVNSYYDHKEYVGRSAHYWSVVRPLLEKIKKRRSIPEPLDPLFMHFASKDLQVSEISFYEEEAMIAFATLLDIEGNTDQAILNLEKLDCVSSHWHLARIYQRLSEEAGNGVEETQDMYINFLQQFKKYLSKVYHASADDIEKLPVSHEEIMDLLNDVKQQLEENGDAVDGINEGLPRTSSPRSCSESAMAASHKFSISSPPKSVSPSKRSVFSPKTPPYWVEDQKSLLQMLCQQVEALKNEVHDLRHNSSGSAESPFPRVYAGNYAAESFQEPFSAAQSFHGVPLTVATTGPSVYYNQSPAYNSQYLLRTAANVTPSKAPVYGMNRLPQPHMYAYQPPMHTPPLQTAACMYPTEQVFGPSIRFESPATTALSPYNEEYPSHNVSQPSTNPTLPEPGYFTKPPVIPAQSCKSGEGKSMDLKHSFGPHIPVETSKVGTKAASQMTPTAAAFKFSSNFKSNDGDFTFSSAEAKNSESLLGLLTSDIPSKTEGHSSLMSQSQGPTPSHTGGFTFGSKTSSGFSFVDGAQGKATLFGKSDQAFGLANVTKPVAHAETDEKYVESDDSIHVEEDEDGPHFEPIVPLPNKIDVKTGEEEEEEMFCNRAKLFRFEPETKEWKERGVGSIKILKHKTSGKCRLLMRREQVLKICANHYITADMVLKPNAGSDKSWVWYAMDYADEMPKTEQLAIRFKTADEAAVFKQKFEEAQREILKHPEMQDQLRDDVSPPSAFEKASKNIDLKSLFPKKAGAWDCNVCCVRNVSTSKECVACSSPNPLGESKPETKLAEGFKSVSITQAGAFTFGSGKSKDASDCSFKAFGSQLPFSFKFGTQPSATSSSQVDAKSGQLDVAEDRPVSVQNSNSSVQKFNSSSSAPSYSFQSGFGAQFVKKPGQWDCSTCSVRNEASTNVCAACQTLNSSSKTTAFAESTRQSMNLQNPDQLKDNDPKHATSVESNTIIDLKTLFAKKEGDWDCDVCSVRNVSTSEKCVSCSNPSKSVIKPPEGLKSALAPSSSKGAFTFGLGGSTKDTGDDSSFKPFGSGIPFSFKFGTQPSSQGDAKCQPSSKDPKQDGRSSTSVSGHSFGSGFGTQFVKKPGQWDCSTCSVRNEPTTSTCVSCQMKTTSAPASSKQSVNSGGSLPSGFDKFAKKVGEWDCDTCLVRNEAASINCVSCNAPCSSRINGAQWDCDTCLVRNDCTSDRCVSCQNPNSNAHRSKATATSGNGGTDFKANHPESTTITGGFKAGTFKFDQDKKETPPTTQGETSSSSNFSFSVPGSTSGFRFGLEGSESKSADSGSAATFLKSIAEQHREKEKEASSSSVMPLSDPSKEDCPLITGKPNTFSFADLAKSSQGTFQFGQEGGSFKGFTGAGEQLFSETSVDHEEDMYKTEENDNIQFEPVVKMPEKVDLVTGEEDEECLYTVRAKLFRFDNECQQWKERGVGNLKLLRSNQNGRLRVLMRREQVLKVCANHWITTTMNLKPLSVSDRAWVWLANDFSDGDPKLEQLAAKFKTPELADEFKRKFEECQRLLLDIPLQTPHKLANSDRTANLIQKAEEMKFGLKDLKSFLSNEGIKSKYEKSGVATTNDDLSALIIKPQRERIEPTLEWANCDFQAEAHDESTDMSEYASPLGSSPLPKNLFRFGESSSGFSFNFQPILSPSKSPDKHNQSGTSVGTDEEQDLSQEEERDGQHFEPVVSMPDVVELINGEENEHVVFSHRAKLYRYDQALSQWKERGIGDIRILQNFNTKRTRLVMRRDQVLKLCANHWIASDMNLELMKGTDKAWIWSALDFAEGEGKVEQLAVRFKLPETAHSFKDFFEKAKDAQKNESLIVPASPREVLTSPKSLCGKEAIVVLEETTKEKTEQPSEKEQSPTVSLSPHGTSKMLVSPPKFVFGTHSVQKIFGSPVSCKEIVPSSAASPEGQTSGRASSPKTVTPFKVPEKVQSDNNSDSDIEIVFDQQPTKEQAELARKLLLPPTFFLYKNQPGYESDDSDDEDYETAVINLKGKLYPDPAAPRPAQVRGDAVEPECVLVWEKKPTLEEERKAKSLQLPLTFFCGVGSDADSEPDRSEDFGTELQKVQHAQNEIISHERKGESCTVPPATADNGRPIDLSTKTQEVHQEGTSTDSKTDQNVPAFVFSSSDSFSFADLAKNSGEYAFAKTDSNFSWANTGAAVFSTSATTSRNEDEEEDGTDVPNNDIHFEPIVSLPEVEVKSGEEDEEVLFKQRVKLFRWDRDLNQWKERGVGDLKILFHPVKKHYRVLMRREQVLKVCANHTITKNLELKPMNAAANAMVWTATDYTEGDAKVEQFAAKFKTQDLAESFRKIFTDCQQSLSEVDAAQSSKVTELCNPNNPVVFLTIAADGEEIGTVMIELFAHIVPKTAENFRALCTGENGFGYQNSIFHRIIPGFMCQAGDITNQDGTGGKSIYGDKFEDENFEVHHTGPGILSMANRGRDSNNSQFFITLAKTEHLDLKHVAFGIVKDGMDVMQQLGKLGSKKGAPSKRITIVDCGQL